MKMEFTATIRQHPGINGAYVDMPFDVEKTFGSKRVKVKAAFDGVEYRGSVVNMGGCYILGITQEIRKQIGKQFGDDVMVTLEEDMEERKVLLPEDLAAALNHVENAKAFFHSLSYSAQKEYVVWIMSAKREATRTERVKKALGLLSDGKKLK